MARPLRLEFAGAVYHVVVRGNERKAIFRDDTDRKKYLERLAYYRERFEFRLLAFWSDDQSYASGTAIGRVSVITVHGGPAVVVHAVVQPAA